jgi:hypothetical protein
MLKPRPLNRGWWSVSNLLLIGVFVCSIQLLSAKTAKQPSEVTLWVGIVGDQYGCDQGVDPYPVLERGVALLRQKNVQVILHIGDLMERLNGFITKSPAEYEAAFNHAAGILDSVHIPWYLTPGDHDVDPAIYSPNSSDRSIEQLFFSNYHPRRPELSPKLYYSFDVGAFHFIALNSLEHLWTDVRWGDAFLSRISDEQFLWLQADLRAHQSAAGIVVFTHQPLWYNVSAWQPVHRLLRQYPVRAVIAGHLHYSQDEGELDGIRYLVVGATGANVKQGSPEAGNAQVAGVVTLHDGKMDAELLPIGSPSALGFASRQDMDRVQALDTVLTNLDPWRSPENSICLQRGTLVMPAQNNVPAVVRLRGIGNPIDIPAILEIGVDAGGATAQGSFAPNLCDSISGQQCVIAPGKNVTISNISEVEFRWPDLTEDCCSQEVPPLPSAWQASLTGIAADVKPGSALHLHLKCSFQGDGGVKYLERDIKTIVNTCK